MHDEQAAQLRMLANKLIVADAANMYTAQEVV
jgi:hypothetical protein